MKIRQKILTGYFIVLVFFVATGVMGIANMHRMQRSYADLIDHRVYLVGQTKDFLSGFEYEALMMRTYFLTGKEEWAQEYRGEQLADKEILLKIQQKLASDDERSLFEKLAGTVDTYNANYAEPMMRIRSRDDLSEQQKVDEIARLTLEQKGTVRGVIRLGEEFMAYQQRLLEEEVQNNALWVLRVTSSTTILAIVALVLGLAAALYISQVIAEPVKRLEVEVKRIAEGDLSQRDFPAMSKDEVGNLVRSFENMNERLRNLAVRMQSSANLIATYSRQLQTSTQNAVETTNATLDQMKRLSGTAGSMLDGSQAVLEASGRAENSLVRVEEMAEKFLRKMEDGSAVSVRASDAVSELEERLQSISGIIQFITLIADQASLLAQKAVTEVAYVSEGGGAFLSLAEEIQQRAREASSAAQGITGLIETVHRCARQAVSSLEEDHKVVMEGYTSAREASMSIKEVLNEMQLLGKRVQEVASATEQVAACIQNATLATAEQKELVDGFNAATGVLNQVANEMMGTVSALKL